MVESNNELNKADKYWKDREGDKPAAGADPIANYLGDMGLHPVMSLFYQWRRELGWENELNPADIDSTNVPVL